MTGQERDYSHVIGDARKKLIAQDAAEQADHDELHAHLHEWPDFDDH